MSNVQQEEEARREEDAHDEEPQDKVAPLKEDRRGAFAAAASLSRNNSTDDDVDENGAPRHFVSTLRIMTDRMRKQSIDNPTCATFDVLAKNNREWAAAKVRADPNYFLDLAQEQSPDYLWIGCADSRVPADQIIGMQPGDLFVHRNIANLVLHTDLNALSVLQYAVQYLRVRHVIVCGHYGCGGVAAAFDDKALGLIDNWLGAIKDVYHHHKDDVDSMPDRRSKVNRLCELNVQAQVTRVASTSIVQDAWKRGQDLTIHGWIYALEDGLIKPLYVDITGPEQIMEAYRYGS